MKAARGEGISFLSSFYSKPTVPQAIPMETARQFVQQSERVKAVDLHPTEPWLLTGLLNGEIAVWNYESKELVRSIKVGSVPVRAAVFIARKNWIVTGSDDGMLRAFDVSTGECVKEVQAHGDFIRSIAVHPTESLILTAGDDKVIKAWNWHADWALQHTYEGHSHYVMQVALNPKNAEMFASASLDGTVKVWKMGSSGAEFTLEGHEKGVNCVSFHPNKPLLMSGSDDFLVKIWDYETKKCIQTLEGHNANVTAVRFHPSLPLIISTAEYLGETAGTVRVWNAENYGLESMFNEGLERAWCVAILGDTVAVGYDKGAVVHKIVRNPKKLTDTADKKTA